MRFWLVVVLVAPLVATAAGHRATPAHKPVVALFPPGSSMPELRKLGLLMNARAAELLERAGKTNQLHARQVLAMADAENIDPAALNDPKVASVGRLVLGADRVVTGSLEKNLGGLVLSGAVLDAQGQRTPFTAPLPASWPEALVAGSEAMVKAVNGSVPPPSKKSPVTQPESASAEALAALADCSETVLRQPMGIEAPAVLDPEELQAAIAACQKAVELDPKLEFARASLALAQAIGGDDAAATKSLAALGEADEYNEQYTLARFWLLTRYQSNEAGVAYLKAVVARHPTELIERAALGETLVSLKEGAKAVDVLNELKTLNPNSSVVWGQLSRALARAGKREESLAAAKKALELAPVSREARLQLASRLIDAAKVDDAIEVLKPATDLPDARGELVLRLGWAYWLKGNVDRAAALFQQALDKATAPQEWRTRGRAFYNLALVEMKRGHRDAAKVALRASVQTGFRLKNVDKSLEVASREIERSTVTFDGGAAEDAPSLMPRESSLFPVNAFGEIQPSSKKPAPPQGLVLYRF